MADAPSPAALANGVSPIEDLLRQGAAAAAQGDAARARSLFEQAAAIDAERPQVQLGLGMALLTLGERAAAIGALTHCARLAPTEAQVWYQLAMAYELDGQDEAAIEHYGRALQLQAGLLPAAFQLGGLLAKRGDQARGFEVFANAGLELSRARRFAESLVLINEALALSDASAALHGAKAHNHLNLGQLDEAHAAAERSVRRSPDAAEAHNLLGLVYYHKNELPAARKAFKQALKLKPVFPQARNNLGNAYSKEGAFEESIRQYRFAINQFPNYLDARLNLAQDLHASARLDEAVEACREVLRLDPANALAHTTLGWLLLGQGKLAAGWAEFEWRHQASTGRDYLPDPRDPRMTLPRPSRLMPLDLKDRRILLVGGGGIGTELFFARFLPLLRARGAAWIGVIPDPKAAPLFRRSGWCDETLQRDQALPAFDLCLALGELPLVLGVDTIESAPPPARLEPLPEKLKIAAASLTDQGPPPYLGLTWRAGLEGDASRRKQVPMDALMQAVAAWPGSLVVLQRDLDDSERGALRTLAPRPLVNFDDSGTDLEFELAILASVDQYLGVSNTNMYLAGLAGKTPWVLVKQPAEWRWCGDEEGMSRWFPGTRLLAEEPGRGWDAALRQAARAAGATTAEGDVINT